MSEEWVGLYAAAERDGQAVTFVKSLLATKDAEIAELRKRVAECEEAVDQAVELAEYLEGHSRGAMAERVKTALSAKFARERKALRDEARECVRRLYSAAIDVVAVADRATLIFDTMKEAIASTPEHLRQ